MMENQYLRKAFVDKFILEEYDLFYEFKLLSEANGKSRQRATNTKKQWLKLPQNNGGI